MMVRQLFFTVAFSAVPLKAHPWLLEPEREKVCGILDCQKLTLEACTHAAQNEWLPLRAVVQVLFFQQLQLCHAIAETLLAVDVVPLESSRPLVLQRERDDEDEEEGEATEARRDEIEGTWQAAVRQTALLHCVALVLLELETKNHKNPRSLQYPSQMHKFDEEVKAGRHW